MNLTRIQNVVTRFFVSAVGLALIIGWADMSPVHAQNARTALVHSIVQDESPGTVVKIIYDVDFANPNGQPPTDFLAFVMVIETAGNDPDNFQSINEFRIPAEKLTPTNPLVNGDEHELLVDLIKFDGEFHIAMQMDSPQWISSCAILLDVVMKDGVLQEWNPNKRILGNGPPLVGSVQLDVACRSCANDTAYGNTVFECPVKKHLDSTRPISTGGASSCSSCSSSSSGLPAGSPETALDEDIVFSLTPQLATYQSNLAPGGSTNLDYSMHKFWVRYANEAQNYEAVRIVDARLGRVVTLHDVIENHIPAAINKDGVFHDKYGLYRSAVLNGNTVVVTRHSGAELHFELFDYDNIPPHDDKDTFEDMEGRVSQILDRHGHGYTLTYVTDYEIDEIETPTGKVMKFEYGPTQGGRAAISQITYQNGTRVVMTYANRVIQQIETIPEIPLNGDWIWTNDVTTDAASQSVTFNVVNPVTGPHHYMVTQDYRSLHNGLVAQPSNVLLKVTGETPDHIEMEIFHNPLDSHQYRVYSGKSTYSSTDGFLTIADHGRYRTEASDWTYNPAAPDAFNRFTNVQMYTTYARNNIPTSDPPVIGGTDPGMGGGFGGMGGGGGGGGSSVGYYRRWILGAPASIVTATGDLVELDYDDDLAVTKKTYPAEGTFEEFALNEDKQVELYTDKLGRQTKYTYDGNGRVLTKIVGFGTADEATYTYEYFNGGALNGLLKTAFDPLYNPAELDSHRTDYTYNSAAPKAGLLATVTEGADVTGGPRAVTTYLYDVDGRWAQTDSPSSTHDPLVVRTVQYTYDDLNRVVETIYNDGSTEQKLYGDGVDSHLGLVYQTKDRSNVVTLNDYDPAARLVATLVGHAVDANLLDGQPLDQTITDPTQQQLTVTKYYDATYLPEWQTTNDRKVSYTYDRRRRRISSTVYPDASTALTTTYDYKKNRLFSSTDPYGRRSYRGYSDADNSSLIRTLVETVPGAINLFNNDGVMIRMRLPGPNAAYLITDAVRDVEGQLVQLYDARIDPGAGGPGTFTGFKTEVFYDNLGREVERREAVGTTAARVTKTFFDDANNVTEVQNPRHNDPNDPMTGNVRVTMQYNGRNQLSSRTEAPGTTIAATTSQTYYLDGRSDTRTDARGNDWQTRFHSCCGRTLAQRNPAGHGDIYNNDFSGRVTHTASLRNLDTHSNSHDPSNNWTIREGTVRYDFLGRKIAQTTWLQKQGEIDPNAPPIAGLDGVTVDDGLTTQIYYDDNLSDGIGLDDDDDGMPIQKLGGGTYNLKLTACINLLQTETGVSFLSESAGSAIVTISPEEEIAVAISDGMGRSVMSAVLRPHNSSETPFEIITYSLSKHFDPAANPGFQYVETQSIDANGNVSKARLDSAGRAIESEDALANISLLEYDNNGNVTKSTDPNGVGIDEAEYDALNRPIRQRDTWGDEVQMVYDAADNMVATTDAKGKSTLVAFDERNRRTQVTDRLSGITLYEYDANSNLTRLTDAEGQLTRYVYNALNLRYETIYPDHINGTWNGPNFGKTRTYYDYADRPLYSYQQTGNHTYLVYDMADRVKERRYKNLGSGWNDIVDRDTFTYDRTGRILTAHKERYDNLVSFAYDDAGRAASESLTIDGQDYPVGREYDNASRLSKMTYPDGTEVERTYTARNQLHQIKYAGNVIDTRSYDVGGRLTTTAYGNGLTNHFDYRQSGNSQDNSLSSISTIGVGTYAYTYDANKNKLSETISDAGAMNTRGFSTTGGADPDGYDDDDRVVYWKQTDNSKWQEWNLSLVGDWNSINDSGTLHNRVHGPAHELLAEDSDSVSHDVKGNITSIPAGLRPSGQTMTLNWDRDNHLTSWDRDNDGTDDMSLEYDALGRLIKYNLQVRAMAGHQCIATYDSGAPVSSPNHRFVFGSYIDEPILLDRWDSGTSTWNQYFYHRNQQYSATALTDNSGQVSERYAYTSNGETTIVDPNGTSERNESAVGNNFMYTGRWYFAGNDELYYFRARWYDGKLGRFCGRDPFGFVDGESLYQAYFAPMFLDPLGTKVVSASMFVGLKWDGRFKEQYASDGRWTPTHRPGYDDRTWDEAPSVPDWEFGIGVRISRATTSDNGLLDFQGKTMVEPIVRGYGSFGRPLNWGISDMLFNDLDKQPQKLWKTRDAKASSILLTGRDDANLQEGRCVGCMLYDKTLRWSTTVPDWTPRDILKFSIDNLPTGSIIEELAKLDGLGKELATNVTGSVLETLFAADEVNRHSVKLVVIICADSKRFVGAYGLPRLRRVAQTSQYTQYGHNFDVSAHHYGAITESDPGGKNLVEHGFIEFED